MVAKGQIGIRSTRNPTIRFNGQGHQRVKRSQVVERGRGSKRRIRNTLKDPSIYNHLLSPNTWEGEREKEESRFVSSVTGLLVIKALLSLQDEIIVRRKMKRLLLQASFSKLFFIGGFCLFFLTFLLYWNLSTQDDLLTQEREKEAEPQKRVLEVESFVEFDSSTENDLYGNSESYMRTVKDEIQRRIERVYNLCSSYHLGEYSFPNHTNSLKVKDPPTPQYSYFFYNKERKLSWCPVYKAGSTSWLYNMLLMAGYSEEDLRTPTSQLSVLAREVYGENLDLQQEIQSSFNLLVVRHPFERLVSAYRDKLSNSSIGKEHGSEHFYKKYGKKIVEKFRVKGSLHKEKEPTFEEFVNYLLKTDITLFDDHWLPVYYSCTPCRVSYSVIAKTETFMRDQQFIISAASLIGIQPRWQHKTFTSTTTAKKYFAQLTRSQILALYQKYFLDFELFDYNFEKYLEYAIKV